MGQLAEHFIFKVFASGAIFKNHIFSCNSSAPITLSTKEWRDAETGEKRDFIKKGADRSDCIPAKESVQIGTAHGTGSMRDKASQALDQVKKAYPSSIPR
jgi:hypothetical protein